MQIVKDIRKTVGTATFALCGALVCSYENVTYHKCKISTCIMSNTASYAVSVDISFMNIHSKLHLTLNDYINVHRTNKFLVMSTIYSAGSYLIIFP